MKSRILFFILFCTIRASLLAQTTYYSNNTTTNFNTLTGWSLNTNGTGANPSSLGSSVRLVVQSGHSKTTSAAASVNRLTIRGGGTVTANHAITITGASDRFEIENGGTYIHNNTGTVSSTIFGGTEAFGESSTFQINNWQSSSTSITSSLNLSATSSVDGNNYYYGNLIINWAGSGNWNQNWPSYPTATLLTAGDFTVQSVGEFRFAEANGREPDVYVAGNFIMNSTGAGNDIVDLAEGNNTIGYLNVYGNITHSNGTITASGNNSTGSIWTYRPGTSYWTFSGGSRNNLNYYIQGAKQVVLNNNFDLGTGPVNDDKMYIISGAVLDAQQYVISANSSNAYINNYGTIRTTHPFGLWTSGQAARAISNSNNFEIRLLTGSTVEYYGANGQTVSSLNGLSGTYDQYQNIIISSANTKVAEGNITVEGVFNFTGSGNYLQVGNNILTIDDAGSISNAGANAYFILQPTTTTNGRLRQNNLPNSARVFPIGSASNYLPATITPVSSGTDFSVSVFRGTTTNGSPTGSAFGGRTYQVDAVWRVDRTSGSTNAAIRFDWITGSIEGAAFAATPNNQIGIWRYESSNWVLTPNTPGPNFVANNSSNLAYTSGVVTTFGTAGSGFSYIVANINVLPGKLLSFTADAKHGENILKWKVADPTQYKRYDVEVSKDGFSFSPIAHLTSLQQQDYVQSDKANIQQTVYYRLKMWDHFNNATYSNVIVVKREQTAGMQLLQNPVSDQLVFRHPSAKNASFVIVDYTGRLFMKGNIPAGNVQTSLPVSSLPAGSYVLQYVDGVSQYAQKFIK